MSEGLRAEDVKEAPSDLSPEMEAVYEVVDRLWHDLEALFGALLPLAKGGLASQEQTRQIWWCWVHDTQANLYYDDDPQCVRNKSVPPDCRIESRTLVGFHPQPPEEEE